MLKKIQIVLSSILLVVCLIACSNNNAEVEELKRQVAELKQQNEKLMKNQTVIIHLWKPY